MKETSNQTLPITCIIPHWNRVDSLHLCLNSIAIMTHLPCEIIVVDDNSDHKLTLENYSSVKVIHLNERKGTPTAKNIGLKNCKTKYVWFIDSDTEITNPNMLSFGYSVLEKDKTIGAIGGEILFRANGEHVLYEDVVQSDYSTENRYHNITQPILKATGCVTTCNFLAPTELICKIGGFHPDLFVGEDKFATQQLIKLGYKAIIATEFSILHHKESAGRVNWKERSFQNHSGFTFMYGFFHGSNVFKFWTVVLTSTVWFFIKVLTKNKEAFQFTESHKSSLYKKLKHYFDLLKIFIRARSAKYLKKGALYAQNMRSL